MILKIQVRVPLCTPAPPAALHRLRHLPWVYCFQVGSTSLLWMGRSKASVRLKSEAP